MPQHLVPDATYPLLNVEEARDRILSTCHPSAPVVQPLLDCLDLVLAEDVASDSDIPPRDNAAMDGYALRWQDMQPAGKRLSVAMSVPAGMPPTQALLPGQAARIMTGAFVPDGANTVVRFEDTASGEGWVEVNRVPKLGANIRLRGEDVSLGEICLQAGTRLRPQEIGMLAALGVSEARVYPRPTVALLSTGDEIAPLGQPVAPGQVRDANAYSNAAQVLRAGGLPLLMGVVPDELAAVNAALDRAVDSGARLIVSSGGVSVGDYDLVKRALGAGGGINFWWVNMKPGKPLAFGDYRGVPFIGLPGNPVAAVISFELFARPAIQRFMGREPEPPRQVIARLAQAVERKDGRRHYLRVTLAQKGDDLVAALTGDQGSGILSSLTAADGLAIIPERVRHLPAGSTVTVLLLE